MSEAVFIEIPATQEKTDGTKVTVLELIAVKYITRISPVNNGTIIWLSHKTPYVYSPLTYNELLEQIRKAQVGPDGFANESFRDFIKDYIRSFFRKV